VPTSGPQGTEADQQKKTSRTSELNTSSSLSSSDKGVRNSESSQNTNHFKSIGIIKKESSKIKKPSNVMGQNSSKIKQNDKNNIDFEFLTSSTRITSSSGSKSSDTRRSKFSVSNISQRIAKLHPSFCRDDTIPPYDIEKAKLNFKNRSAYLTSRSSPQITITNGKVDKYEIIKTLGTGSFGRVMLVRVNADECQDPVEKYNVSNGFKYFSMKLMKKERLRSMRQLEHVNNEKRIMGSLDFPFVVRFYDAYKDNCFVFLRMEYMGGGEMFTHLRKNRRFNENMAKFFASQVVLAFEYFHHLNILYRDLKPENLMLGNDGYLKITDMGFAKEVSDRTWTMCGTPEYLAPEIILNKGYNSTVDWWALGVLIYEMCAGFPPFYDVNTMKIYEKILQGKIKFLPYFSYPLKDIIKSFLEVDVTYRLGNMKNGIKQIKDHEWFLEGLNWHNIYHKKVNPNYNVLLKEPEETINFDDYSEEELPYAGHNECEKEFLNF